jgi:adenosine deaminase CECR1
MEHLSTEEWEAFHEELPSLEEPFLQAFVKGRENLIAEEKKKRSDAAFREALSPIAKEACEIVEAIRQEERETIWTTSLEEDLAKKTSTKFYPGMMFSLAKDRMEKTKLWRIVRKMPKGALLHAHMDAMVDFEWLFVKLLSTPGMHIRCTHALSTPQQLETAPVRFCYRKSKARETSIWSEDYVVDTPVPVFKVANEFPAGGREGFLTWLKNRMTITHDESLEHHHGVDVVWQKFQSVFPIINSIIFYEPIFRMFMQRMLKLLSNDGVRWVDLRLAMMWQWFPEGRETPLEPLEGFREFFKAFGDEIEKFKKSGDGKKFWGARMIWTGIRRLDTRHIIEDMDACLSTKLEFPDLIAGYDLVGQEDLGRPLKDCLPELFWFRKQCAQEGVEIPFFFHAGETLGDGSDTDQNLFDAILLGTRRIGHGFSLYKHPLLIDMVKDKKILVESCPISNEVLRLCASVMSHPLPALLARGVSCALCNDDPAILGQDTAGMTHDFWQALQGWDNLGLAGLGSLAENSVRWAAFEDETNGEWLQSVKEASVGSGLRAQRLQEYAIEWEKFCLWIVTEFGSDASENTDLKVEDLKMRDLRV